MDDERIKKFEKIRPALTRYIQSMLSMLEARKSNINFIFNWILEFQNYGEGAKKLFFPNEIERVNQVLEEIPDMIDKLQEMEIFLRQYKENFSLLPLAESRFNLISDRVGSAFNFICECSNVLSGHLKWH